MIVFAILRDGEKSNKMWDRALDAERHQIEIGDITGSIYDVESSIGFFIPLNLSIMLIRSLSKLFLAIL